MNGLKALEKYSNILPTETSIYKKISEGFLGVAGLHNRGSSLLHLYPQLMWRLEPRSNTTLTALPAPRFYNNPHMTSREADISQLEIDLHSKVALTLKVHTCKTLWDPGLLSVTAERISTSGAFLFASAKSNLQTRSVN